MNPEFHARLVKRLDELLNQKCQNIVNGSPADWGEYKYRIGYVKAINDVLAEMEEIVKRMNKGD